MHAWPRAVINFWNKVGRKIITRALRDYFAPEALDSVCREVVHLADSQRRWCTGPLLFRRTSQTTGEYLLRSDLLRQKAEARMQMGGSFPGTFVAASRMQHAPLPRVEQSLVSASARGRLEIATAARQMRLLFGPTGGTVRQDAPAVTEVEEKAKTPSDADDFEVWKAYRKAEKDPTRRESCVGQGRKSGTVEEAGERRMGAALRPR